MRDREGERRRNSYLKLYTNHVHCAHTIKQQQLLLTKVRKRNNIFWSCPKESKDNNTNTEKCSVCVWVFFVAKANGITVATAAAAAAAIVYN